MRTVADTGRAVVRTVPLATEFAPLFIPFPELKCKTSTKWEQFQICWN
jgi:hypothetical protein